MKRLITLLTAVMLLLAFLSSCSKSEEKVKKTEKPVAEKKEEVVKNKLPEGFPKEITVPDSIKLDNISEGDGVSMSGGTKKKYKSYELYIRRVKNGKYLVDYYKKLFTKENGWTRVEWSSLDENSAHGYFEKGNIKADFSIKMGSMFLKVHVMEE